MSTIVVAGFGRCGSSLAMQMLAAGGVPCVGEFPSFEHPATKHRVDAADIARWSGHAVKVLDPHRVGLPGDVRVIWMLRDANQQARSFAKFSREVMGLQYNRTQVRTLAGQLARDTGRCLQLIGRRPHLVLRFEDLLHHGAAAAQRMAAFVGVPMDAAAAAGAVLPRSPQARADMSLELWLMEHAQASAQGAPAC